MNTREQLRLLILAVLARQPEHGYAIAQAIHTLSDGLLIAREGTLYPVLHAMEGEGLIQSEEQAVGGRVRREYQLTPKGRTTLKQSRQSWTKQVDAVQAVLGLAERPA